MLMTGYLFGGLDKAFFRVLHQTRFAPKMSRFYNLSFLNRAIFDKK